MRTTVLILNLRVERPDKILLRGADASENSGRSSVFRSHLRRNGKRDLCLPAQADQRESTKAHRHVGRHAQIAEDCKGRIVRHVSQHMDDDIQDQKCREAESDRQAASR